MKCWMRNIPIRPATRAKNATELKIPSTRAVVTIKDRLTESPEFRLRIRYNGRRGKRQGDIATYRPENRAAPNSDVISIIPCICIQPCVYGIINASVSDMSSTLQSPTCFHLKNPSDSMIIIVGIDDTLK